MTEIILGIMMWSEAELILFSEIFIVNEFKFFCFSYLTGFYDMLQFAFF